MAQPTAAAMAQSCTPQKPATDPHIMLPKTTPSAATWARAMSMKMMPRRSTIAPSGTCVDRMISPATRAGPRMAMLRAFTAGEPVEEAIDRIVVEREEVGGTFRSADGHRHLHQWDP